MNALTFSVLRMLSHAEFRSGEDMASALGVTRASVSNALAGLEQFGVRVFKLRGQGYRLAAPMEWLDQAAVMEALGENAGGFSIEILDVAESTNTLLLQKAGAAASHASVVAAEFQSQGKGRRGRRWETSLGGALTFSLLWRFNQGISQLGGLSLAIGVAIVRALREIGASDVALKWPNDLLHQYRKLGGILIELQGEAMGPASAVIGVGINLRLDEEVRQKIDQAVTDVESVTAAVPKRNLLLGRLLFHMATVLREFEQGGFAVLRDEWQAAHAYHERHVSLLQPSGQQETGRVCGISEDGMLMVETSHGLKRYASGEISLRAKSP